MRYEGLGEGGVVEFVRRLVLDDWKGWRRLQGINHPMGGDREPAGRMRHALVRNGMLVELREVLRRG